MNARPPAPDRKSGAAPWALQRARCGQADRRQRRGFALVPALFLLVVLGALALSAVRVGTGQQNAVTMGVMEARALAAARTGIEWGAYSALHGTCTGGALTLTEGALSGFSVVVTCSAAAFSNATAGNNSATNNAYSIQATATSGIYGQPGYVRRIVVQTVTDATS